MKLKDIFSRRGRLANAGDMHQAYPFSTGLPFFTMHGFGGADWSARDYATLAVQGFQRNAVAYRCVRMIAEAASSVPVRLLYKREEVVAHPLLDLLQRPNMDQSLSDLLEKFYAYLQVSGNAYLEVIQQDGLPKELYVLRPDRIRVVADGKGYPIAYEYQIGSRKLRYDIVAGSLSPLLHHMLFHPLNDHYGMNPMEAAGLGIDIHNAANAWNKALFDNAARPSGALVYRGPDGAPNLTEEQFSRLKGELEQNYQGSRNAGRPLLLEGGLSWTPISLSPQDMDFIHAKHAAAREIALAFGVPPMLLGIPGDNTYANYAEANRAFWRQTIVPLIDRALRDIGHWLSPAYTDGDGLTLDYDRNAITALAEERSKLWQRIGRAAFLTVNEKRQALGYGPIENGDVLEKPSNKTESRKKMQNKKPHHEGMSYEEMSHAETPHGETQHRETQHNKTHHNGEYKNAD